MFFYSFGKRRFLLNQSQEQFFSAKMNCFTSCKCAISFGFEWTIKPAEGSEDVDFFSFLPAEPFGGCSTAKDPHENEWERVFRFNSSDASPGLLPP
mmetsp:Transcript_10650/g.12832  ORF Transcript_10650/g.12832 Transcript_10650/m.12832 type:complete len:96 (-) Transcript_10650:2646-2933(-)